MSINYRLISRIAGVVFILTGTAMLPCLILSRVLSETRAWQGFAVVCFPLMLLGLLLLWLTRNHSQSFRVRDGYFTVAFCWLSVSFFGALPYLFSGAVPAFADAFFESSAAFTTTGCSVLADTRLPDGLILWKAVTHWLGGMGILIFTISILPALGLSSLKMASAESPGPSFDKVRSTISDSTRFLYVTYIAFTLLEFFLLLFSKMNVFEAVINTLGSVSTSGLASHADGISHFDNPYIESVISVFTLLTSVNFMVYSFLLRGKWKNALDNTEVKAYFIMVAAAISMVSLSLFFSGTVSSLGEAFRFGAFQSVAFSTTSGYAISDYTLWPSFAQAVLFLLMCIGGCSASTSGSFKMIRVLVLLKLVSRGFRKRLHPRSVVAVKLGRHVIPSDTVFSITVFSLLYFLVFFIIALLLSLDGQSLETTLTAAMGTLSNTGLAFGDLGPTADFSLFSPPFRLLLSFAMIVGRLELFTIILLFTPYFWSREK